MVARDARVAVVIITRNRWDELRRTLSKLSALPEHPEIVVVDNDSTDATCRKVPELFPDVQLIAAGKNLGAAGRTLGVQHVQSPYIAFCDDDCSWRAGDLTRAADLFDAHPALAVITARIVVGEEALEDPVCRQLEQSPLPRHPDMPGPSLLGFMAGASVVRRTAFLQAGGFPEQVFIGGEEALLAVDLASRGWWLCYISELLVHHFPSPQRDAALRRAYEVRNALWFAWLRRPWRSVWRKTWQLAGNMASDASARHGFALALAGLGHVLRERRVVALEVERGLQLLERAPHVPRPQALPTAGAQPCSSTTT